MYWFDLVLNLQVMCKANCETLPEWSKVNVKTKELKEKKKEPLWTVDVHQFTGLIYGIIVTMNWNKLRNEGKIKFFFNWTTKRYIQSEWQVIQTSGESNYVIIVVVVWNDEFSVVQTEPLLQFF